MTRHPLLGMLCGSLLILSSAALSSGQALWTQIASACPIDDTDLAVYTASGPSVLFRG